MSLEARRGPRVWTSYYFVTHLYGIYSLHQIYNFEALVEALPEGVMGHLVTMLALRSFNRLHRAGVRVYGSMHDPLDLVTGIEKRELLAHLAGDCDPFRMLSIKKGSGTKERPNLIPSSNPSRIMCCLCNPNDGHLEYMWLHSNEPKRCGCGYWFELCPVAPL